MVVAMFTGIVEEIGIVKSAPRNSLAVRATRVLEDVKLGDSIAVNGVCLTVVSFSQDEFSVGLMPETLRRSNLGALKPGDRVNLERALAVGARLGGHFVQGHVDGMARLISTVREKDALLVRFEAPPEIMRYIVPKGFIAVDGTSLTVVDVADNTFRVSLVQFTQENIILPGKKPGYLANVEVDILGKYVEKFVAGGRPATGITEEFLSESGFLA